MVSLALNWSPPDSSPLFDESGVEGNQSQSSATNSTSPTSPKTSVSPEPKQQHTQQQTPPGSAPSTTSGGSSASSGAFQNGSSGFNTPSSSTSISTAHLAVSSTPSRTASASPQPRSYAQAAEQTLSSGRSNSTPHSQDQQRMFQHQQQQQQQQAATMPNRMGNFPAFAPQPGFPQPGFGHNPNLYFPAQVPTQPNNQFAWAQYQQMLAAQSRHYHSQDPPNDSSVDSRRRATSGPQRPQQMNYSDNMQHYPGAAASGFTPARSNSAQSSSLPPGAMAPPSSHSVSGSNSASQGFHPYRRGPSRTSDAGYGSGGSGVGVGSSASTTSAAAAAAAAAAHLPPPSRPRARTSSTNSSGSDRSGTASDRARPQPTNPSYSSVTSGSLRGAGAAGGALSGSSSPSRAGPPIPSKSSNRPDGPTRTESSSTAASAHTAGTSRPYHSRAESFSSASSQQSADRTLQSSTPASGSSSVQGSGRSTPTAGSKKPSPLSHSGAAARLADEDDADTSASYGGSDDDTGGRTTPIPGSRGKEKDPSKKSGLSGKLRKALSFNALPDASQQPEASGGRAGTLPQRRGPSGIPPGIHSSTDTNGSSGSARSTSPPRTPDNGASPLPNSSSAASISSRRSHRPPISGSAEGGGKRSIFNRKFNSSTDNISISSTVSSASVMLRKVGNLGKMARRHSLMGLTNMFNKDKDGREGLQDDSFGAPPTFPSSSSGGLGDEPGTSSKKDKKNKGKKGVPAAASISHATVELESGNDANGAMTSAASYARQHQAAAAKAEAEARAQREKAEAEAKLNASKKGKTTDDVMENRQKAIEKEKERLKSKRGWRKKLSGGSVSSIPSESSPTGLETTTYAQAAAGAAPALSSGTDASSGYGGYSSPELAGNYSQQQQGYEDPAIHNSFDAAFDDEELEPPHMPVAGGGAEDSGDECETDSLRHWGEGIERSRASAQSVSSVKSILKNQANPNGPGSGPGASSRGKNAPPSAADRPFAGRVRANSYDAQPSSAIQSSGPHHAPLMNQMSNTPAGVDRMDGVPRSTSASESDHRANAAKDDDEIRPVASVSSHSGTPVGAPDPPMGHHSNASMPTLSLMIGTTPTSAPRAVGGEKRRIAFAEQQIYHSTWPAHVYDRRGELATCNRLTPLLAQRIKEELNTYKMEEMQVAASSRIHTHFFV